MGKPPKYRKQVAVKEMSDAFYLELHVSEGLHDPTRVVRESIVMKSAPGDPPVHVRLGERIEELFATRVRGKVEAPAEGGGG